MTTKRYFWLKLNENFFEEDTIAWIEEQPNGKEYSLLYLKLCLKSLKTNGHLIRNVGQMLMPYDPQTIAKITNTEFDTVIVAMELFKKIGLVTILENGAIYLPQLQDMVGSESKWAKYKRKNGEKNNGLEKIQSSSNDVPKLIQTDIDIEKEKEKEKELNKDKELEKEYREIIRMFNDTCLSLNPIKSLTANRKKSINTLMNAGFGREDFRHLFLKTANSKFLNGENNMNWMATFDWLINENNAAKVIEGNYDNKIKKSPNSETSGADNPFLKAAIEMGEQNV